MNSTQVNPLPALLELAASQLEVALQNTSAQVDRLAGSVSAFVEARHRDVRAFRRGRRRIRCATSPPKRSARCSPCNSMISWCSACGTSATRSATCTMRWPRPTAPPARVLLAAIRARYTMEDERQLFDVMLAHLPGAPTCNARQLAHDSLRGSVELF